MFFSGDTGLTTEYREIRERLGPFDLTMLEVGAWHPSWGDMHLGPENALKAHALLGGAAFVPIHWGTYRRVGMRDDEPRRAAEEFRRAAAEHAPGVHVAILEPGESLDVTTP